MIRMIIRILCATTLLAAAIAIDQRPAQAQQVAPWCAIINTGTGSVYEDCHYRSFEACYPNILAGNRGFCNPNPAYRGIERGEYRRHVRRHHVPQ